MKHIFVVEDDASILQLLKMTLKHGGFAVSWAIGLSDVKEELDRIDPDLAVIDIGLKDGLGYEIVPALKEKNIPFLFLTARGHLTEKLYGIELGADDYMVKPFEPLELVARIKMILRRTRQYDMDIRRFGNLLICSEQRLVKKDGEVVPLSPKEFDLLDILSGSPGRSFERDYLLETIWGYESASTTRTVDTHILNLRQKIGHEFIRTVFKIGYAFAGDGQ